MSPIRVMVVDDQPLFREGLCVLLSSDPEIEIVGEAGDGEAALVLAARASPDVALMDLRMPGMGGVEATARLRKEQPSVRVLALTTFDDDASVFEALRAGALGYLLKDATSAELFQAIRAAAQGASFLQPRVASKVVGELARRMQTEPAATAGAPAGLSEREIGVLKLLAAGSSNREIAQKLFIAEGTVKNHLTSIFTKLEVTDRTQAALKARDLGLL